MLTIPQALRRIQGNLTGHVPEALARQACDDLGFPFRGRQPRAALDDRIAIPAPESATLVRRTILKKSPLLLSTIPARLR